MLYHFTSIDHVNKILEDGYLALTPSNLIKPKDMSYGVDPETGSQTIIAPNSDPFHRVVWMTNKPEVDPGRNGLAGGKDKTRIRFSIPEKPDYYWWHEWSDKLRMNKTWKKQFTFGQDYGSWYVCEHRIPLEDVAIVEDMVTGEIYWKRPE